MSVINDTALVKRKRKLVAPKETEKADRAMI
jgi:hypothetical protein